MTEQVPIRRLLAHTKNHRSTMWLATLFSILNKIFDLAPPLLIGAAVDVVVKQEESALSDFGYSDPKDQLIVLSILTVIIWVFESLFEYIYGVLWRNLAQTVQHELRLDAYFYQPFILLAKNEDGSIQYTEQFKGSSWLSSSSLVYHSRIGPIRATLNWFPQQENQFAFQFSYGYVLFNERAIR